MIYYGSRMDVALFVADILMSSEFALQSITITQLVKSEDFSVNIVTDTQSDAIVEILAQEYSLQPPTIYFAQNTPA